MTVRKWLVAALAVAGITLGVSASAPAAEKKAEYTFGTLRAVPVDSARAQSEAWLKSTGHMDQTAFGKIWGSEDTTVLDKVAETLKLGSPDAAKLLSEASIAEKNAPKAVPDVLKDAKQNAFFRANLALAYARGLSSARVYEESLATLKLVAPEQVVDPSAYFFHRAVAEHALIRKKDAIQTIIRLLDDVADAPDRYKMLATIMFIDMQSWKAEERDLGNIAKLMDNVERRLGLGRGGPQTQEIQKKIVFRLDELIKEKESQCKGGQCNGGNCPNGGKPGSKPGNNLNPSSPMQDSQLGGGQGAGKVDEKKLRAYSENWGKMNERDRAAAMVELTRDLPPKYKVVIEEYFKSLSRSQP